MDELMDVIPKLENNGLSKRGSEILKSEVECIGHKMNQNGIRPLQDKIIAIKALKKPENERELKSILSAIQFLSKYIENFSVRTNILRQLLKKDSAWNCSKNTPKQLII